MTIHPPTRPGYYWLWQGERSRIVKLQQSWCNGRLHVLEIGDPDLRLPNDPLYDGAQWGILLTPETP